MAVTAPSFAPGATLSGDGVEFAVYSRDAARVDLCLFDNDGEKELARLTMGRDESGFHRVFVEGATAGTRYGFRADGVHSAERQRQVRPRGAARHARGPRRRARVRAVI